MTGPYWLQLALVCTYLILALWFAQEAVTWPLSAYYAGCVIKDAAVMALALYHHSPG